jgi:hypothetical protein
MSWGWGLSEGGKKIKIYEKLGKNSYIISCDL